MGMWEHVANLNSTDAICNTSVAEDSSDSEDIW
jgi:hypothetical protein